MAVSSNNASFNVYYQVCKCRRQGSVATEDSWIIVACLYYVIRP